MPKTLFFGKGGLVICKNNNKNKIIVVKYYILEFTCLFMVVHVTYQNPLYIQCTTVMYNEKTPDPFIYYYYICLRLCLAANIDNRVRNLTTWFTSVMIYPCNLCSFLESFNPPVSLSLLGLPHILLLPALSTRVSCHLQEFPMGCYTIGWGPAKDLPHREAVG